MTVVVTGASGHLGSNLIRALLARCRRVRALVHHDRRSLQGLDVEAVEGDVLDPASLRRAFAGADVVYHAAGHISIVPWDRERLAATNILGVRHVVEACLASGVRRLVHFSSIHAYSSEPRDETIDESRAPADPRRSPPYDRSKAAGEREVRRGIELGLDAVILNPTAILGPYDYRPSHFGQALLGMARGRLPALVPGGFDWVDARDVAAAAIAAAELAVPGARYLLGGHWLSVPDLAALVAEITGTPAPRFTCPLALARLGAPLATAGARLLGRRPLYTGLSLRALQGHRYVSYERATRDLGYNPRPFRDTLVDTLDWFRCMGWLGTADLGLGAEALAAQSTTRNL